MAGFGSSSDDDFIAGINVTPLVDVVLVLLVIFLMTAPTIYQSAIQVQLPRASTGESSEKSLLNFTLNPAGEVAWGADPLGWEELASRLKALGAKASEQTAFISADRATPHGSVVRLMDLLRQSGLTRFAMNVDSRPVTSSK